MFGLQFMVQGFQVDGFYGLKDSWAEGFKECHRASSLIILILVATSAAAGLWDPTVALCLGTYGDPMEWVFLMSEVPLMQTKFPDTRHYD